MLRLSESDWSVSAIRADTRGRNGRSQGNRGLRGLKSSWSGRTRRRIVDDVHMPSRASWNSSPSGTGWDRTETGFAPMARRTGSRSYCRASSLSAYGQCTSICGPVRIGASRSGILKMALWRLARGEAHRTASQRGSAPHFEAPYSAPEISRNMRIIAALLRFAGKHTEPKCFTLLRFVLRRIELKCNRS